MSIDDTVTHLTKRFYAVGAGTVGSNPCLRAPHEPKCKLPEARDGAGFHTAGRIGKH